MREFAAREGVNAQTLMWWRWKLSAARSAEHRDERAQPVRHELARVRAAKQEAGPPIDFVEIVSPVLPEPFEVEGAGRYRVRVPARFEHDALARLLDVLEER